jgi:hypothetical protein
MYFSEHVYRNHMKMEEFNVNLACLDYYKSYTGQTGQSLHIRYERYIYIYMRENQ